MQGDPARDRIHQYVEKCSRKAYRTLVFAGKQLTRSEYDDWLVWFMK